ncbi:hypothetical protein [Yoonia algicola]|uniref:Uncharacterized protein n=1 Tax=Yoonia algicola TaxID=3137368 RepID=A0AAN0LZH5_9RHOB
MRNLPAICAAILLGTPALAVDDCLLGTWEADLDALSQIMGRQMNGTATPVGGNVLMTITPDGMANMVVNDLVLNVVVPNVPPMDVSVSGVSSGVFVGEAGDWSVVTATYTLVGSANVMGQTMTIPFDSATGVFGGGAGSYTCDSSVLAFTSTSTDERIPPRWSRAG